MSSTVIGQLTAAVADRYRIDRELGAGGMATVYLAHDIKHDRDVAIKVLHPDLGAALGGERFLSEIKTTAKLQHPPILPLLDSGNAGNGLLYYVMPLVVGESLRARLERERQLPIPAAVRIAREVASALDYAHRQNVIHRDIKPENILLHDGQAIVADFGIALAVQSAGGARLTQTGLSLGTPQYMSPEQAMGEKTIDARSDIYALATVTYEMLSGEPPFSGTSVQAIVAKVLTERPTSLQTLRDTVPPHVEQAVFTALAKLPADRFESAKTFSDALANPALMATAALPASQVASNKRLKWTVATTSLVALVAVAAAVWSWTRPTPTPLAARFEFALPDSVTFAVIGGSRLDISRDGSKIVLVGEKQGQLGLYLRRIDDPVARLIRGTVGELNQLGPSPVFTSDGESIVFRSRDGTRKISVEGGTPQRIGPDAYAPSVGDNGTLALEMVPGGIMVGNLNGGEARLAARPDSAHGIEWMAHPDVLPSGDDALVTIVSRKAGIRENHIGIVSLRDGVATDFGIVGSRPRYVKTGHIVFARKGNLVLAVPFSLRKRVVTGRERLLLEDVFVQSTGESSFAVSDNGTLVYALNASSGRHLVAVDVAGKERVVPGPGRDYNIPRLAPNARQIVTTFGINGTGLWLVDLENGAMERLTDERDGRRGEWSRDGTRIWYTRSDSAGVQSIVSRAADRGGADQVLLSHKVQITDFVPGPVHGFAAFRIAKDAADRDIYIAPMDSLIAMRPFVATSSDEIEPAISADGHFLAYASNETGHYEVYVQAIPGPGARVKVSVDDGTEPVWSPTGHTIYYRGGGQIMSVELATAPLGVSRRASLFPDRFTRGTTRTMWNVFPDGRQFLFVRDFEKDDRLFALLHWPELGSVTRTAAAER